jgi:enamine deaminase RidA (YjgF/YER057c/UK114 family)
MSVYDKLKQLGITLPAPIAPAAAFVMTVQTGNLLFVSGHIARRDGKAWAGQLGAELATQEGKQAARNAAIDVLATMHHALGDLNKVTRIVKVLSLVNSTSRFSEHHLVSN